MAPYRTRIDLINEALANLGVLAPGQAVDPEDFNYVDEKLDGILRNLAALEIVYIADIENIPGLYFNDLADIVADDCATKFGASNQDFARLQAQGWGNPKGSGVAAKSLKQMSRGRPTYEPLRIDYF